MSAQASPIWTEEEIAAAHEAGHAVVAVAFGVPFQAVDIIPHDDRGGAFHMECPSVRAYIGKRDWKFVFSPPDGPRYRSWLRTNTLAALAAIHAGYYGVVVLHDDEEASAHGIAAAGAKADRVSADELLKVAWRTDAARDRNDGRAMYTASLALVHILRPVLVAVRDALLTQRAMTRDEVLAVFRHVYPCHRGAWRLNRRVFFKDAPGA